MMAGAVMNIGSPLSYFERDLSESSNDMVRDENHQPGQGLRRSFSWSKKRKSKPASPPPTTDMQTDVLTIRVSNEPSRPAYYDLGMETHAVTGDIIVSYIGPCIEARAPIQVGDCILAINGLRVGEGMDDLEVAREALKEPHAEVELVLERSSIRTEVLRRHAALRGTSLDKLGMTLMDHDGHVVLSELSGLAAKSRRLAQGDRLISIGGKRFSDLNDAVSTLFALPEEQLEVIG